MVCEFFQISFNFFLLDITSTDLTSSLFSQVLILPCLNLFLLIACLIPHTPQVITYSLILVLWQNHLSWYFSITCFMECVLNFIISKSFNNLSMTVCFITCFSRNIIFVASIFYCLLLLQFEQCSNDNCSWLCTVIIIFWNTTNFVYYFKIT